MPSRARQRLLRPRTNRNRIRSQIQNKLLSKPTIKTKSYPRCRQRRCPSRVAIPRIEIAEVFAGVGAAVADVAMAVATVVIEVQIEIPIGVRTETRSEHHPTAAPNHASLVLSSRLRPAPRIPPDISPQVRLLAISQFFFLANRFQSTSAWRSNRQPSIRRRSRRSWMRRRRLPQNP